MRSVVAPILCLVLSACAAAPPPPDVFYRLDHRQVKALTSPALPGVVEVATLSAEGLAGDRALLSRSREHPDQVARYSYHFWGEPPPLLVRDELVRVLREAGAAAQVVTANLRIPADFIVEGRLKRFEQVVGGAPAVVVEAELGVVRVHGNGLLLLRDYLVETPAAGDTPGDAVAALQLCLDQLLSRFVSDLSALHPPDQH